MLLAAADVLDERGLDAFTVDEVARRSGVSKATIYKHWTGGLEIAVEAYGDRVTEDVPVVSTGDAVADLTGQIQRLARLYASPRGRVVADLLAAGARRRGGSSLLRERFFARRRDATVSLIEQGKANGQIRDDVDTDLVIDLLFGAIVFRLFNGVEALDADGAAALASLALRAIVTDPAGHGPDLGPRGPASTGH